MPKRSGSNKLRSSKRSGPRSQKSPSKPSGAPRAETTPRSEAASRSEPKAAAAPKSEDRDSSPSEAPARPAPKQSLLERFNELPITTRYAVIGAVVAIVIGIAYFAMQSKQNTADAPKPAPTGAELAPPQPIMVPPALMSALANPPADPHGHQPPSMPAASAPEPPAQPSTNAPAKNAKPETTAAPPSKPAPVEPPKTAAPPPPAPPKPAPAPKQGGGDNPY